MLANTSTGQDSRQRIAQIDMLRGFVIVIMALDHTREFTNNSGWAYNPLGPEASPLMYATRWITHLCAPTFVFLSGASIRFQAMGGLAPAKLARRIATRGLWLVFLELTVIGFAWSFSIPFLEFLQVIWAIGWSMVLLAGLVFLPPVVPLIVGAAIITASSVLATIPPETFGSFATLWSVLFRVAMLPSETNIMAFAIYPIVPWFGVMALGYGLGALLVSERRERNLALLGLGALALFLVLRLTNIYGDFRPWKPQDTLLRTIAVFLDVTKNPPSLSYVLVTLGLSFLIALGLVRLPKAVGGFFRTFGAVPLAAYVAHLFVMHAYAVLVRLVSGASLAPMTDTMRAFLLEPERFGTFSLPIGLSYLVWLAVVATIYPFCRWWSGVKRSRRDWWLSYL